MAIGSCWCLTGSGKNVLPELRHVNMTLRHVIIGEASVQYKKHSGNNQPPPFTLTGWYVTFTFFEIPARFSVNGGESV